jgi:hypothetical protein
MAQADADARAVAARAFHAAQVADGAGKALLEHLDATASALERAAIALRPGEMAIAAAAVQAAGGAHGVGGNAVTRSYIIHIVTTKQGLN